MSKVLHNLVGDVDFKMAGKYIKSTDMIRNI